MKEETGVEVRLIRKVGEYHEFGIESGQEYDYYPACFLAEPLEGEFKKQESEIGEVQLFKLNEVPKSMAFLHAEMIDDFIVQEKQKKSSST